MHENKILIVSANMDQGFEEGTLMYVAGREDAKKGDLGTIVLPKPALDVSINPQTPDPVVFSYSNTEGNIIRLRSVLFEIDSVAGELSTCTVSVLVPAVDNNWVTRTKGVTLVWTPPTPPDSKTDPVPIPALRNPHGLAQLGDYLYFIDYETHLIARISKDELEGAADGASLEVQVYDLNDELELENPRGQAIIALGGKIYALVNDTNIEDAETYGPSRLVRLSVDSATGALSHEANISVGKNAQSIVPIMRKENDVDVVYLLIPAIGGKQHYDGATNGVNSNIFVAPALGDWDVDMLPKLTGDAYSPPEPDAKDRPTPSTASAYDIHAIGAAMRNGQSQIFILTQVYNDNAKSAFWTLYQTSVNDLFLIPDQTTLTGATQITTGVEFELLDQGLVVTPDPEVADAIYFWDILYEQTLRDDDDEDRIWLLLGSPFLVTKAEAYGSPTVPFANPFVMFSGFGGINVNSVDLIIETLHQAMRDVSLKRGSRGSKLTAGTIRAARAMTAETAPGVEADEEDK
jgi:hypothetical protein